MVTDLVAGAHVALPDGVVTVDLRGPYDLSAVVLGADGRVDGDRDFVFYNQLSAAGVTLQDGRVTVAPDRLRSGGVRVVVMASPEVEGLTFARLPAPTVVLSGRSGAPFARFVPLRLRSETAAQLVEVYRRDGRWRVRAVGQGYADGLAGLARDFGVDVEEEPAPPDRARPAAASDPEREVVAATNAERRHHGLAALSTDARLGTAARQHSADMVRRGFFAHQNPDGAQVWDRALAAGYRYRKVAENIAAGQQDAAEVVRGWMNSPGHRANILDAELTQIGVGLVSGGPYGTTWTQVFGTPR